MKTLPQDKYYLEIEGDSFFHRNFNDKEIPELRDAKKAILDSIAESEIEFSKVLEYGCCYGDILFYLKKNDMAAECVGVEASQEAIDFGISHFGEGVTFEHGVIAENGVNGNPDFTQHFDLIIVDDVFGWVSRETILQSVANIDSVLADNGCIFIRDFYPDKKVKNQNHHVEDAAIYNYKVPGSHASLFIATGMYEVVLQKTYYDNIGMSTDYKCDNPFNYRWTDVILRKSVNGYFDESKKL